MEIFSPRSIKAHGIKTHTISYILSARYPRFTSDFHVLTLRHWIEIEIEKRGWFIWGNILIKLGDFCCKVYRLVIEPLTPDQIN